MKPEGAEEWRAQCGATRRGKAVSTGLLWRRIPVVLHEGAHAYVDLVK